MRKYLLCTILMIFVLITPFFVVPKANADILFVVAAPGKPTYNPGEPVVIAVDVKKAGIGLTGAKVFVSIEFPGGGITGGLASPTMVLGTYRYLYNLSPSAAGGVYKVVATASKGIDNGKGQTSFTVIGTPAKKTVNWAVFNPSSSPSNPTTADSVRLSVLLRIVTTISPGPYPVDISCSVGGLIVGGGTLTITGTTPITVYTDPKKFPAGTHTAIWVVDPNFEYNDNDRSNNQVSLPFTVTAPAPSFDFSLTASPNKETIKAGQSATFSITASLISGCCDSIALSVEGIPSGASYKLSTTSGTPTFSSTLTIETSESTPLGDHTIIIKGVGGGIEKDVTVTLSVESGVEPDFEISSTPNSQTITWEQSATYLITINGKGGFNSDVSLAISGLPAGVNFQFNPPTVTPNSTSTLTLKPTNAIEAQTYALTIFASGAGKTKSIVINLIIQGQTTTTTTTTTTTSPTTTTTPGISIPPIMDALTENAFLMIIAILAIIILALAILILRSRRKSPETSINA